ncbi:MAG: TetR/AcrR family transcriptional regulator [Herbiconiux sp.]|nr:TetR/AcrR family transcriptional regulator [Herbiconiux sp.]
MLEELVQLFLAEGFAAFGVDDLARRLKCSKSTLYALAPSREQLVAVVVREFFRRSTDRVELELASQHDPLDRIGTYLRAIAGALAPASNAFFADLERFAPAREIYRQNTAIAAGRVRELVATAEGAGHAQHASFIGAVAATVMESIQLGEVAALASINDARAYQMLADLVVSGVTSHIGQTESEQR